MTDLNGGFHGKIPAIPPTASLPRATDLNSEASFWPKADLSLRCRDHGLGAQVQVFGLIENWGFRFGLLLGLDHQ